MATLAPIAPLEGMGSPSRHLVAQVFNLCVFQVRIELWCDSGRRAARSEVHAQVAAGGVAGGLLAGEPLERPGEITRGDVAVELDLHGMLRG